VAAATDASRSSPAGEADGLCNLDQLRHQVKDLLRAAQAGDAVAAGRITVVSSRLTLSAAGSPSPATTGLPAGPG
jgi:hypothetical protein